MTSATASGVASARVSTLMYASQQGNVEVVRGILRHQPKEARRQDRTGKTALHYCCTSDNSFAAQAADFLVMAAPDLVETRDEDGFTPLHLAVIAGNMQLVTFLLANHADVTAVDNEQHTVVHWATVCGETSALRAVLAAGAPVSTPDVHGGYPLHYAAQMCGGDNKESTLGLQVLQTLLSHKDLVVSVTDGDQREPLLWAASAGSTKAVLALIRAGALVESCDKDGLTALHCAASRGHTDCIDTLLTLCGASPDVIDSNGCTALHYAVTLGHADATSLLLAHGADPNRQDRKGRSPAHCGCAKGQLETVKLIASHQANLWLRNARGDLPLHEASGSGRRELVKWLLEMRPSQVNARNNDGRCPLHMAALNDNSDMCKILLDTGAHINPVLRTSKNVFMTPLDCALQRGFRSTAKFLQLHGGVPASRVKDQNNLQTINSAASLNIRDDITLLGESSSDSEPNNSSSIQTKKVYRKRMSFKMERKKKTILSDSEAKSSNNEFTRRLNSRGTQESRLDYSNEIIINGKTEINIHQTREIISSKPEVKNQQTSVDSTLGSTKGRRPRSVKFSAKCVGTSGREKTEFKDQSTNTSLVEITVEEPFQNDQQSLFSNTSEDIEASHLVVEATVHPPPAETLIEEPSSQTKPEVEELKEEGLEEPQEEAILKQPEEEVLEEPNRKELNEESKEVLKEEPKEVLKEEPKEELKEEPKEEPKQEETLEDQQIAEKLLENLPQIESLEETKPPPELDEVDKEEEPFKLLEEEQEPEHLGQTIIEEQQSFQVLEKSFSGPSDPRKTSEEDEFYQSSSDSSSSSHDSKNTHQSFRVLTSPRSHSEEPKPSRIIARSRIPGPINRQLSRSDKYLDRAILKAPSKLLGSLPNLRSESNLSQSIPKSNYSDIYSESEQEETTRKKRFKKKSKKGSKSAGGSDYESSNVVDSGFEPSPRASRIPKPKHISNQTLDMTSVTRSIQSNIRRYHLERKIFQQLLELKRLQIRSGQHNEAILVKRAIDSYHNSCASTVGAGRYLAQDYSFRSFEKFLYQALRKLQKNGGADHLKGLPETTNPLHCTQSTYKCMHAAHAYTGVPCAAYLPKMDHHSIPKIGYNFSSSCKPGQTFLPTINPKKGVTLEVNQGPDKQIISLPTEKLSQNKRYYVTFTVKGKEAVLETPKEPAGAHRHSRSE